jgi:hypothetical protein
MILFLVESEVELGLPVPGTNIFEKKCYNKTSDYNWRLMTVNH